jgi:hypothetical protein
MNEGAVLLKWRYNYIATKIASFADTTVKEQYMNILSILLNCKTFVWLYVSSFENFDCWHYFLTNEKLR